MGDQSRGIPGLRMESGVVRPGAATFPREARVSPWKTAFIAGVG
jgi:hypothetical protein